MANRALSLIPKLHVLAKRPSRLVDYLREPRDFVIGGPLANKLGLQVARTVVDHVAWSVRRPRVSEKIRDWYDTVTRDGIVVIRDFLPPADFEAVWHEYEKSRGPALRARYQVSRFGENLVSEQLTVTDWPDDYPETCRALRDNPILLELASAVTRRPMSFRPHLSTQVLYAPDATRPAIDYNEAQFLHSDRHFPFVKAFLYLADVDERTAPYTFVPGSHIVNMARLRYEYELSLRVTKDRKQFDRRDRVAEQAELHKKVYEVASELMHEMRLVEQPVVGKANTLILSNNMGLHRRGEYSGTRPRITINLDYKYLESRAHHLYPLLRRLPTRLVGT